MAKSTARPNVVGTITAAKIVGINSTQTQAGSPAGESTPEYLIGADEVSLFIAFKPITILRMAKRGLLPTIPFPIGKTGKFRYKFKLSQLQEHVESLSRPANAA